MGDNIAMRAPSVKTVDDLKVHAARKLPKAHHDYYNDGSMDMITLQDNVAAFQRYRVKPRAQHNNNVQDIDTSSTLFGRRVTFPLALSPTAMQKLAHPDGEVATSRAAASHNIGMCLSSYANTSLEEVKLQGQQNPYMMQMCVVKDRGLTKQLLDRAERAGYKALFLSADVPVLGRRLNEFRNNFTLPPDLDFPNILSTGLQRTEGEEDPHDFDPTLEWDELIPWLRNNTNMQIWLKGVSTPEDVILAIQYGVDGILISNHGGRQLDGVPASLDCLRECAPIAKGKIQIGFDGGIRQGSDIFKALALGADHCFAGRMVIWGLAYGGQQGVELGIKILLEEFRETMALAGCRSISDITPEHLEVVERHARTHKL